MRFVTAGLCLAFSAAPAFAGLEICNDAGRSLSVAIGYADGDTWVSKGWWNIDAGDCKTPLGGDLKNRYYYYRANSSGSAFASGDFTFCTTSQAFTISGDSECAARGYESTGFRKLDTGKTAKQFTLTLVDNSTSKSETTPKPAPPPPAPAPATGPAPAGTYGEPYSNMANLQDCTYEGARTCSFHADGTKFYVSDDGRTPQFVFAIMEKLDPGTPIEVQGDLEAIYDRSADVVLRDITIRPWTNADSILNRMQGSWYSVDDPNSQFNILGSERDNTYDGAITGRDYISVSDWCDSFQGAGPYLYAREEETGESYCYAIDSMSDFEMTLMYLPGGNFLSYRKLD
ncbi:hypothetical protein JL2886_00754 [Phaeobacter gallaeciensis]|uniref:DUF1036 domain-containing protein n=1 Tax=Phaeobacter gallaeciensis TaxID=60890 RepID=A0A1B0ZNF6_9RHOB|nr:MULTISPECIES: DUF1036 domain-containing protein [Phaeobacter]MEE2635302.1 DUF1036 domain-containing protein [Pseudomonadota bacterium]ANP35680.1 hypothetical protein JL2886_00754 [Phaeobacter gallaeciensis]MDE4061214.1 DUF1036 domain-containing protein [Phaeobacter gallaeciensis]MDE4098771.1 DUF1036 domain-containing protein [Phaeobacter gallaeciensis]MDE4107472.1 DUF1036 domain-containing protein [Phaeobacter gallaeciensis]